MDTTPFLPEPKPHFRFTLAKLPRPDSKWCRCGEFIRPPDTAQGRANMELSRRSSSEQESTGTSVHQSTEPHKGPCVHATQEGTVAERAGQSAHPGQPTTGRHNSG